MPYLLRKISFAKWPKEQVHINDFPCDPITSCLRTQGDTLSVWEVQEESSYSDVILALACNLDSPATIHVVFLDPDHLNELDIEIAKTNGETAFKEIKETHRDLAGLTYSKLGRIANYISSQILNDRRKFLTKSVVRDLLLENIKDGKVNAEDLSERMQKSLKLIPPVIE